MTNKHYDVTTYQINVPKSYDGPEKMLVLADMHGDFNEDIKKFIEHSDCDSILIPGDFCNGHFIEGNHADKSENIKGCLSFMKECAKKAPTFYSRGNHEWMIDRLDVSAIEKTGVIFLENNWKQINDNVMIGAIPSAYNWNADINNPIPYEFRMECVLSNWRKNFDNSRKFKIVLCHHPEYYKYVSDLDIGLFVSGHAHGGQIRIFDHGLYAPGQGIFPKLTSGCRDNRFVISRGMTNTAKFIPRLGNRPEIVVIETRKTK